MFAIMPVLVLTVFGFVIGSIVSSAAKRGVEWHSNNNSPVITSAAKIVTKRIDVSNHRRHDPHTHHNHNYSSTTYYITFEDEDKNRLELRVAGSEYGLLVEGDTGNLTFQGTRYMGFERFAE